MNKFFLFIISTQKALATILSVPIKEQLIPFSSDFSQYRDLYSKFVGDRTSKPLDHNAILHPG
jgi:hypothetical protein